MFQSPDFQSSDSHAVHTPTPHSNDLIAPGSNDGFGQGLPMYRRLGAHRSVDANGTGVRFSVWAPNAQRVSVIGDFNHWNTDSDVLDRDSRSGVWSGIVGSATEGQRYKFHIVGKDGYGRDKCDPVAFASETPPATANRIVNLDDYHWRDQDWMTQRLDRNWASDPISIYELHLGSWRHDSKHRWGWPNYRTIAEPLVQYLREHGFTHVELMPISEHPLTQSWGYQSLGYFAVTSRYGTPADFKHFVDVCHQNGIGVIVDWVPAHFPKDEHGLARFDGGCLYEHPDPRLGEHPDWGTLIFDYGRPEVVEFLISNALFWMDVYHVDGLRVDAVSSMLYRDYSRQPGQWLPNEFGGNENLEAISFLRKFNEQVHHYFPGALTIAEESTAWPGVTTAVESGGLGFDLKWNMGWMNDSLRYFRESPAVRKHHHDTLTFSLSYTNAERYCLALSHDEVVHGKRSLLGKMPGDEAEQFANLRLLYAWMWAHPGKKLLFMGGELGTWCEWNCDAQLDWSLLENPSHQGLSRLVKDLNTLYRDHPSLHRGDHSNEGFQWIDGADWQNSVVTFLRRCPNSGKQMIFVGNFGPQPQFEYRIGMPGQGPWREVLNTDSRFYGGNDVGNPGSLSVEPYGWHGREYSMSLNLPALGAVMLAQE